MPKTIGFQWQRYEAWRHHPLLQFDRRNALPGVSLGVVAFLAYVVYDKSTPKEDHH